LLINNNKKEFSRGGYFRNLQTSYEIPGNIDLLTKKTPYIKNINMPKEHQDFLYDQCKKYNLDFHKVMALISLESSFNKDIISETNDYGYMQINLVNHDWLSETTETKNNPLDPYINIKWGTYLLNELYRMWGEKEIDSSIKEGEIFSKLDEYVMSSYNKGVNGFKNTGLAEQYIEVAKKRYKNIITD
jgi:soluble lytic murein transglycosylase-like protein